MRQLRMSGDLSTRKTGAEPPLVATATVSSPTRIAEGSGQSPARTGAGSMRAIPTRGRESQENLEGGANGPPLCNPPERRLRRLTNFTSTRPTLAVLFLSG